MNILNALQVRFRDPGSIRSLVLLLFLLRGQTVDEGTVQVIVDGVLSLLALASFTMAPKPPVQVVEVPEPKLSEVLTARGVDALASLKGRV